jgi:putative redox protein
MAEVTATLDGANYAVAIAAREHRLASDEAADHGGRDQGPNPYELLLAGLGACTVITLRMYAERKGWAIGRIEADLQHRRDGKRSKIARTLRFEAHVTDEQRARLAEIAEKTPVTLTLKEGADIATALAPRQTGETAEELDRRLDEALEDSFPASDPPSVSPEEDD